MSTFRTNLNQLKLLLVCVTGVKTATLLPSIRLALPVWFSFYWVRETVLLRYSAHRCLIFSRTKSRLPI